MDIGDHGEAYQQADLERALASRPDVLPGPSRCVKCGLANDRAAAGFAVCGDCVSEGGG